MKKFLSLALAAALVMSLCACGEENIRGEITSVPSTSSNISSEVDASSEVSSEVSSETPSEVSSEVSSKETSSVTSTVPQNKPNYIGTNTATKYTNEFAGITCELGSEWTFMTDEQIRENNKLTLDILDNENYREAIESANTFTDMYATHSNGTDTINVTFEKLPLAYADYTPENYAYASTSQIKSAFEQIGFNNVRTSMGTTWFAGKLEYCVFVDAKYSGADMHELMVILKRQNYMVLITACTWGEATCSKVLENFKAI